MWSHAPSPSNSAADTERLAELYQAACARPSDINEHLPTLYALARGCRHPNLLDVPATVEVQKDEVVVRLDRRAHCPYLVASQVADEPTVMLWFGGKRLAIRCSRHQN
jgi:hypothetical protein